MNRATRRAKQGKQPKPSAIDFMKALNATWNEPSNITSEMLSQKHIEWAAKALDASNPIEDRECLWMQEGDLFHYTRHGVTVRFRCAKPSNASGGSVQAG